MTNKAVKIILFFLPVALILTMAAGVFYFYFFLKPALAFTPNKNLTAGFYYHLLLDSQPPLKTNENRVNLLLLGAGGGDHEGPYLTDSIIVLSVSLNNKGNYFVSLPRDIWIDEFKAKINAAYALAEEKKAGSGLALAKYGAGLITGLPIHYAFLIDFRQFKTVIDIVNGVDVFLTDGFTDNYFPVEGMENALCGKDPRAQPFDDESLRLYYPCRYKTVEFKSGLSHLNSDRALDLVRSRHAENTEGSDFARSKRQQTLLNALMKKIIDPRVLFNKQKLIDLGLAFDQATVTDLSLEDSLYLAKILFTQKKNPAASIAFNDLLINPPVWQYQDQWVLVPKESFEKIHDFIKCKMTNNGNPCVL